jgi:circadian clock protein KaiC
LLAEADRLLDRIPTGIASLDQILQGGLLKGGLYLVEGSHGTGKTVLGNQVCFQHADGQGRALFVTLMTESHARMLQHMRTLSFFDDAAIPSRVYYVSGYPTLEREGLPALLAMIRREIDRHRATLAVIDGFGVIQQFAPTRTEFRAFVDDLQCHAAGAGCSMLLLTTGSGDPSSPERTMVDGVIELEDRQFDHRTERSLHIPKLRGTTYLRGRHSYRIKDCGIVAYPRIEAAYNVPPTRDRYRPLRMETGVEGLDQMLRGGLPSETSNAVFGPTGTGKTTFGLQYVSLSSSREPGLFFGMYETPERLRVKAAAMGIDLPALEERGDLEIIWRPQGENMIDDLGHQLIEAVQRRGVKRLFLDGFGGLLESAVSPDRLSLFGSTLSNTLRALNATTVVSMEMRDILGADMTLPTYGLSSLLEGLIVLRYAEVRGKVQRLISITKIRDSDFDPYLHEVKITDRGMVVGGTIAGLEALLSGFAREPNSATDDSG